MRTDYMYEELLFTHHINDLHEAEADAHSESLTVILDWSLQSLV